MIVESSSKSLDGPPGKVKDSHGKYYDSNGQKQENKTEPVVKKSAEKPKDGEKGNHA